jgi:V-type H+-transporting ATPase subunit d
MGEFFFNIDHGYLEGLIRGFKSGLLTGTDYSNLVQCETLEGLKLLFFKVYPNLRLEITYSIN